MDDRARSRALQGFYSPAVDPTAEAATARDTRREVPARPRGAAEAPGPLGGPGRVLIRCLGRVHFEVEAGIAGRARVLCRECRVERGEVVIHTFDLSTGRAVDTQRYRSTRELFEEQQPGCAPCAGTQRGV